MFRLVGPWPIFVGLFVLFVAMAYFSSTAHVTASPQAPAKTQPSHFEGRIAPLLAQHCLECHGPTSKKGGLDLSRKANAFSGGKNGQAIVAKKPDDSLLWEHVEAERMPPKSRPPITAAEKMLLQDWIANGADWPDQMEDISSFVKSRNAASAWVRRLTVPEYVESIRSLFGVNVEQEARELFPADLRADGFRNTAYNLTVDLSHVQAYAKIAEIVVRRVDVEAFAANYSKKRDLSDDHLRGLITAMGGRVLRGPVTDKEREAFLNIAKAVIRENGDFPETVRYLLEAMLQSPRFLYRIENHPSPYALASRISYILWGAPPDAELLRAAEAGELNDQAQIDRQIQRMLLDRRAIEQSKQFFSQWMDLDRLSSLRPDPKRFKKWDPQLAEDMREETLEFFEEIAWTQRRPLSELMNAQVTFLTPRLADHYGLTSKLPTTKGASNPNTLKGRATRDLQALYTFQEGSGDVIRDVAGVGTPLNLKIEQPAATKWGAGRLTVSGSTKIAGDGPPKRLIAAIKKSNEVTLEAWVTPASLNQSGPARILTLSDGPNQRNFTLGQDGTRYQTRLRTTKSDLNGQPTVDGPTNLIYTRPTHIVFTRDVSGKAKLYIDGSEKSARDLPGNLSNWEEGFRLMLANETTNDRPWKGTYHLVAVYSRALSPTEVLGNARGLTRFDLSGVPERGGLLTQASILTVGGDDASTVTRGLFILKELLYGGVDDPPPGVDTTPVPAKPGMSQRAIALTRINNVACSACHKQFESISFGLEKFDGIGAFRTKDEHGNALREDGTILFPDTNEPIAFQSTAELMNLLAKSDRVSRAISRKVTQFALGRPLTVSDEPIIESIHETARKNGGTYAALITAIVQSDLVQKFAPEEKSSSR